MKYPLVRNWLMANTPLEPALLEGAGFDAMVADRVAAAGVSSESEYVETLRGSEEEAERLTAGVAVPETWFFRYQQSYKYLAEFLERRLAAGGRTLTMASIGCAAGEEPYGMAMVARHAGWSADSVRIEAIDRSREALRRARAGEYGAGSIRTEIPVWAADFLNRTDSLITVDPEIRGSVRFVNDDATRLGALPSTPTFDVIFCRNLMIYLGVAARVRLLDAICAALVPGGLLFVGHADTFLCVRTGLRAVKEEHTFCFERTDGTAPVAAASVVTPIKVSPAIPNRSTPRVGRVAEAPAPARSVEIAAAAEATMENARDLADAGRLQECEEMLRALLAKTGPTAEALELLGMIRMGANDPGGAKACFTQALYLEPQRTASILQLAMIYEQQGDGRRAEAFWNRARRSGAADTQELGR